MARKILVTTDLSGNSKAGLRFAIQLACQQRSRLIFYHVMHAPVPTTWSQEKYMQHIDKLVESTRKKVKSFVEQVYRQMGIAVKDPECVVEFKPFVDDAIIAYARMAKVDFICMSTLGAGILKRVVGTNTSSVLSKSPIPVLAIPHNYRRSRISHVLYASDFTALPAELKAVKKFADTSKARLSVIHYADPSLRDEKADPETVARRYRASGVNFDVGMYHPEMSIPEHLKRSVKRLRPSVLALFTRQDRNLLERIFPLSNAETLSFDTRTPLLVFPKQEQSHEAGTGIGHNQLQKHEIS